MKKSILYKFLAGLFVASIIIAACTKEEDNVTLAPTLTTSNYTDLKSDSVTVVGFVVAQGGGFTEKGVCYSTSPNPTVENDKVIYNGDETKAAFKVKLYVDRLTTYYVRAYAINSSGVIYGEEYSFATPSALPALAGISASTIATTTDKGITATTAINITDDGGPHTTADITSRGVVYGTYPGASLDSIQSTIKSNATVATTEGVGEGQFTSLATQLNGNVKYYLRAYATNSIGTTYSNEVSFTTPVGYAFVNTREVSKVAKTTVTLNGVVTSNGGGTITERGFVYALTANPTVANTKVPVAGTKDTISADISGLEMNTEYHVRAYVTNEKGTNYGAEVTFKTLANITKFWIVGDATENGWNNDDNAPFIISTVTSAGEAEGYVYLKVGNFKLTTDHSWADAQTFGDDGSKTGKLTNPGSDISVTTAGYYLLKANQSAMTYSLTPANFGIIGGATADGWNSDQNMVYSPVLNKWVGTIPLTADKIKFRANDGWDINFGDSGNDGSLEPGGADIPVTVAGTYSVLLDLSTPWNYKYSLTKWGLIGNATGSWDVDKDMTPNADNTWTITTALSVGEIKFRANDGWDINYGGANGKIVAGGDNIKITAAGTYTITLNLAAGTYTITQ
jgi:hypothetical protein